jgi:mono/diheme cytochrome c family protein
VTYRVYCRSCHGTEGRADGSLAPLLKVAVPDLTTLARQAGGELPEERVTAFIDGREEVAAHGPREMPVWGDALGPADDEDGREEGAVQQKIRELVAHLASIQE